jgi:hypothetical protein
MVWVHVDLKHSTTKRPKGCLKLSIYGLKITPTTKKVKEPADPLLFYSKKVHLIEPTWVRTTSKFELCTTFIMLIHVPICHHQGSFPNFVISKISQIYTMKTYFSNFFLKKSLVVMHPISLTKGVSTPILVSY